MENEYMDIASVLKLAQNQLGADRSMCDEHGAALWDIYEDAITKIDVIADRNYRNGFTAGWNAAASGDEQTRKAVDNRLSA